MSPTSRVALLLVALLVAGCATPYTEAELEQRLERVGAATGGLRRPRVVAIHADSRAAALGLLAEARANADSPLSAALGRSLAAAHRSRRDVVAGGPFADLTDRALRNALALQPEAGLPGLRLVVASQERPSGELQNAARRARVRLIYRAFR
jgi:hypothetical protein